MVIANEPVPVEIEDDGSILLVDDRPDKQLALQVSLEELGHRIVTASSGSEALRLLLRQDFAVVLLDVSMPGMDGFETAALIRQRPKSEHTPIIFITSVNTNETHLSRGYSLGAVDYIFSPIEPEILRTKVGVFLELYKKTQQVKAQSELLRKQAEQRAVSVETRLHGLLNRLNVGIFRLAANGVLSEANPALLRLIGAASLEEAKGFDFKALIAEVGVRAPGESANERLGDVEIRRNDGTPVWVALSLSRSGSEQGGVFIDGLMEDITERKKAETSLKNADRLKDEFLAMLAHELRNPLAPIRNAVEIMKIQATSDEHTEMARSVIDRQVRNITRLVDDLLDVSRITQGKITLQSEPTDLKRVVARALETSGPLLQARKHRVRVVETAVSPTVFGDETRLAQVLANLLNNAAKYTPEGGEVIITTTESDGWASMSVKDSGIGIPSEMLPTIFDLFIQVDRSLDRSQGGLGIGLTLVRTLVELHGGAVEARSGGPGEGSEFIVRLPLVVQQPENKEPAEPWKLNGNGRTGHSNLNILVVDDNVDSAESLALFFQLRGNSVHVAHNGPQAIALAQADHLDLVFLDIGLPEMDGYEVARRLRPLSKNQKMRLVALTGYGRQDDIDRAHAAGFDEHFTKPVDIDDLERFLSPI